MRTVVLRVAALALLLLLALFSVIAIRTMQRLPDTAVYFALDQGASFTLKAVHEKAGRMEPAERAKWQVARLALGPPSGSELTTTVPSGTRVLNASFSNGLLSVNLSREFEEGGGSAMMLGRLNQLYYTLTQPKDVEAVALLIEGEPVRLFGGEGIIVQQPWWRPEERALPVW